MSDAEDHAELIRMLDYDPATGVFRWRPMAVKRFYCGGDIAGSAPDKDGYLHIKFLGKRRRLHRVAWFYVHGKWPAQEIDHINGFPADNRIENLREATRSENRGNSRKPNRGNNTLKGATYVPHGKTFKWRSQICKDKLVRYLGFFDTEIDAHRRYLDEARILFGEFASDGRPQCS